MEAGKRNISAIFSGSMRLEIPFFQRSYVWGETEWERFLEDIEAACVNREPYFMGSLILKQKATATDIQVGNVRLVVDGQQRLTTLSILMKVLSLQSGEAKQLFDRQFVLVDAKPALLHNHNDEAAYNRIMMLTELCELKETDSVTEAYNYFRIHADTTKLDYYSICSFIYFVGIDLNYDEDEQQIFDTINSLGVRLTTAELLKNYFFGRNDIEAYKTDWLEVFEKDEDTRAYWDQEIITGRYTRTYIDLFFYSFLMIKIQDSRYEVSTEHKIQYSKVDRLFESYKSFIKKYCNDDKTSILKEIRNYAEKFSKVISDEPLQDELPAESGISRLNAIMFALDTATLIPYVLYLEMNVSDLNVRNSMYEFLETYIMRRLVTRQTTKNYNHLFSERLILNRILTKEDLSQAILDNDASVNRMPTDAEVIEAFHTSILTNRYAAGVLYLIESKIRNRTKHSTQLLGINKYSLEHLMPKKWRNYWEKTDTPAEAEARDRVLLTLGNLTIITQSLNASVRDADWDTKKNGKGDKGGLRKYADGIETLSEYLDREKWDEQAISDRAEFLAKKAISVWTT